MGYKIKDYAKTLATIMMDSGANNEALYDSFLKLLKKNGELKNAKRIIDIAERYYLKQKGNKKVVVETARKINTKVVFSSILVDGDFLEEKVNPDLVAGVKISVNGAKQIDFSMQRKLNEIFNK